MKIKLLLILNCIFLGQQLVLSQLDDDDVDIGTFSGNIQAIAQYYQEDTLINAALPEQLMGFNGFTNLNYNIDSN